jgi:hypothetical protein
MSDDDITPIETPLPRRYAGDKRPVRELSIWLDAHCPPGELGVFRTAAELQIACDADVVYSVSNGLQLLDVISKQPDRIYEQVDIAGHGGTTWLLHSRFGVTSAHEAKAHLGQITVQELAKALAPKLVGESPLISLSACMCSRSPTWWLKKLFGENIGSDWGKRAYLPGGLASFSARLRDYLAWYGVHARVRGHRAAGHATALALLAEHKATVSNPTGTPCETFYGRCFPDIEPDKKMMKWWVANVTGQFAQRWLLGDDTAVEAVRNKYKYRVVDKIF